MEYILVPNCTVSDASLLAKNNMTSFWQNSWYSMLFHDGSLPNRIRDNALRMPHSLLKSPETYRHQKIVHVPSGEIVGYARWILPVEFQRKWEEAVTPRVSDVEAKGFEDVFGKTKIVIGDGHDGIDEPVIEMHNINEPKGPFLKLDYICTRPDHQRKGISSMLVQSGIEQANKLNVDIYVLAMGNAARDMYQKAGFECLCGMTQDLGDFGGPKGDLYHTYSLVKHPSV